MHLPQSVTLLAAFLPAVLSFADTSPYILVSPSALPETQHSSSTPISTGAFLKLAESVVKQCHSDVYVLVSQPTLEIGDLAGRAAAPQLKLLLASVPEERRFVAANVYEDAHVSQDDVLERVVEVARKECDAEIEEVDARTGGMGVVEDGPIKPKLLRVEFTGGELEQNDAFLHSILGMFSGRVTLIYTSTPLSASAAAHDYHFSTELRRRAGVVVEDAKISNSTKGGLFAKYQFFTPGIFMGYIALFVLASIVYVGISSLSSLTVSYGAFEKEMGPQAAKKQQ